jgi:murein DD-endopeptidase MepM/ murein hydrolase activator NlpD
MPKIQVITEEMLGKSKNVNQGASDILSSQNNVTGIVRNLGKDFSGKLPTLMTEHMLAMESKYKSMNENITQYGKFLEHAANSYEWNDKELAKWATALGGEKGASVGAAAGGSPGNTSPGAAAGNSIPDNSEGAGSAVRPVQGGTITSHHGGGHHGIDYAAPAGTPIVAAKGGRIVTVVSNKSPDYNTYPVNGRALTNDDYGNYVVIEDDDGNRYIYAHMRDVENLREGDRIETGTQIGSVGNTGNSSGPHLHFEMKDKNKQQKDPLTELGLADS